MSGRSYYALPKCVNWMGKTEYIEAGAGVYSEGKMVPRGRAKCRLWVDSEEYLF